MAPPACSAPTGCVRRSSPARLRRPPTSWSRRPSTSAWPSTTSTSPAPSRCGPRPSWRRSRTGSARWPITASRGSCSSTATAATSPPSRRRSPRSTPRTAMSAAAPASPAGWSTGGTSSGVMPAGAAAVPRRPRQPRHAVGDRHHPVGLSGRHQGRELRAADRAHRPDPRSRRFPREVPRRPHGLRPRCWPRRKGGRPGQARGGGTGRSGASVRGRGAGLRNGRKPGGNGRFRACLGGFPAERPRARITSAVPS